MKKKNLNVLDVNIYITFRSVQFITIAIELHFIELAKIRIDYFET